MEDKMPYIVNSNEPYVVLEHLEHLQVLRLIIVNMESPQAQNLEVVFEPGDGHKDSVPVSIEFDACREDSTVFDHRINGSEVFAEVLAAFEREDLVSVCVPLS